MWAQAARRFSSRTYPIRLSFRVECNCNLSIQHRNYKHYSGWQEALEDAGVSTQERRSSATSRAASETESDDIIGQIMAEFGDIAKE